MKTVYIIETPEELMHIACKHRVNGDDSPCLNREAKLIFENDMKLVRLEGDARFQLMEDMNPLAVIKAMARRCDIQTHFT